MYKNEIIYDTRCSYWDQVSSKHKAHKQKTFYGDTLLPSTGDGVSAKMTAHTLDSFSFIIYILLVKWTTVKLNRHAWCTKLDKNNSNLIVSSCSSGFGGHSRKDKS